MTDLTERLRASVTYQYMPMNVRKMMSEAATTLETLTQENARLREARDGILEALDEALSQYCEPMSMLNSHELGERLAADVAEIVRHATARKALGGGDE